MDNLSKYWLVCVLGCCIILITLFYQQIQYGKRIDKIFEQYDKDWELIREERNN